MTAFGLAITNIVYLGLLNNASAGKFINAVYNITGYVVDAQYKYTQVQLEQSMVFLWTIGSFLHSTFDMLIWYIAACSCFRPGGITGRNITCCQNIGLYTTVLVTVGMVFVATLVVLMRLNEDTEIWCLRECADENSTIIPNATDIVNTLVSSVVAKNSDSSELLSDNSTSFDGKTNATGLDIPSFDLGDMLYGKEDTKYAFLVGYAIELTIALFLYYPLTSTMFFSGILGCGRIPILGGRPYELRQLTKENSGSSRCNQKDSRYSTNSGDSGV